MTELDKYIIQQTDKINTIGITDVISEDYLKEICEGYYKLKALKPISVCNHEGCTKEIHDKFCEQCEEHCNRKYAFENET